MANKYKDEMKHETPPNAPPHHAYGEGGPEKQGGKEGPDTMPPSGGSKRGR